MAQGQYLHLRLFLEGVEVPVVAASIQMTANTPASASIQIIATDKVLDLLPRTVVHLFFYDYVQAGNAAVDHEVLGGDEAVDFLNSRYKLLFMGELVTIKFQKQYGSRAVVLECADFSNYWDTTFQYNFGGSLFGGRRKAAFIGANSNFFTSPLGHGTGTISRLLNGRSVNFPKLRGLLAGVVRMLEAIGGSYYGRNSFRGANDFTSIAELRVKVLQQITAAEADTSTARLFARKAFNMWMNRSTGSLGKLVSFRGLVKICFGFIFHEVYPCPVAKFIPSSTRKERRRYSVGLKKTSKYRGFAAKAELCRNLAREAQQNLTTWKNSRGSGATFSLVREAARVYLNSWSAFHNSVQQLWAQGMAQGPKKAQKNLSLLRQLSVEIRSLSYFTREILNADPESPVVKRRMGTLDRNYKGINSRYSEAISVLSRILGVKFGRNRSVEVSLVSRVNNQIFRPDVWYTAPPRCNVLFPEHYETFSFARQYLREVSRLELQTHNEILGNDALFNGRYYAPNVEDVRRGVKLSSRRFARLIMDHELYTGIIPMFENLSEANLFAMRSGKVRKAGAKVGYAQRAVNFQYFKYRFESRGMEVTGRFNPMFVPGFPTLIIDKYMDESALDISALNPEDQVVELGLSGSLTRSEILKELVGPQYLGTCATLMHSISQEGGRSSYNFTHSRVHRESTEFLGVDKATVTKATGSGSSKSVVAATPANPPKVGKRGIRGGRITRVKDVTNRNRNSYLKVWGEKDANKVRVGSFDYINAAYQNTAAVIGENTQTTNVDKYRFRAYEVTESHTRYKRDKIDLPIEEAIRPPWIWDGWAPPKVSETYDQLFGIGALTDIGGFNIAPTSDFNEGHRFFVGQDDVSGLQAEETGKASSRGRKSAQAKRTDARAAAKAETAKNQNAVLLQEQERTIENSVDFLIRSYSFVKVNNLDVGDFLRAYTWRPVATMVDILGGSDLEIKRTEKKVKKVVKKKYLKRKAIEDTFDLNKFRDQSIPGEPQVSVAPVTPRPAVYGYRYVSRYVTKVGYEVSGKEGFHSRAFGDVEDLFGLVSPTVKRVLGLSKSKRKVAAKLDVRKRRRAAVRDYVGELTGSRGLIG